MQAPTHAVLCYVHKALMSVPGRTVRTYATMPPTAAAHVDGGINLRFNPRADRRWVLLFAWFRPTFKGRPGTEGLPHIRRIRAVV
jgi:hypothetical protein